MMKIADAITLAKTAGNKYNLKIEDAKKLWDEKQEKTDLTEKQIQSKTYSRIKMIQSLVNRDGNKEFLDKDTMSINIRTVLGVKTKKVVPFNIWVDVVDADGKVVFSSVYKDWETGKSIVEFADGSKLVEKGWKKVREHFYTGAPQVAEDEDAENEVEEVKSVEVEDKQETEKPTKEKTKKAAAKKASNKAKVEKPVVENKDEEFKAETISNILENFDPVDFVEPEIPEELK